LFVEVVTVIILKMFTNTFWNIN